MKKELEEAAENYVRNESDATLKLISKYSFKDGAKWMQERMYSEEDMYKFANFCRTYDEDCLLKNTIDVKNTLELFEQFKKEDKQ